MKPKHSLLLLTLLALRSHAGETPLPEHDYQSLQIASSTDVEALKKLYQQYVHLPYLRVERRGAQHVLRAGFWQSRREAQAALPAAMLARGQLRTAALRPEALVQSNWSVAAVEKVAGVDPRVVNVPQRKPEPVLPPVTAVTDALKVFNQDDFLLAYDVLVATGDLQRAYQIAQQAVEKLPADKNWRRKWARVAEATQRPAVAATQWQALYVQGDRAPDTLAAVIRLASQMENSEVVLQVLKLKVQQPSGGQEQTDAQWRAIFDAYEALSQPEQGSTYFESQFERTRNTKLLDYAARLASSAGDDDRALALNLERARLSPFSLDAVLRAVVRLVRTDRLAEALALLQAHDQEVPRDAAEYWRLLGQIAWDLGQLDVSQGAYRNYARTAQATPSDWSRLVFLVRPQHPEEAAELAMQAYRRFGAVDQLMLALEIYAERMNMPAQTRIYSALQGDALGVAESTPRFRLLRAQYYQRSKMLDQAWADLQQALRQTPDDKDTVLSVLWFLIDENRTPALAAMLHQYASAARDPAYWLPFAAGNQALGNNRDALRWYAKQVQRTPQDPLLLLNYADALERSQKAGMAARVRRHAWLQLQQLGANTQASANATNSQILRATVRLALLNQPGDPALQRVRRIVQTLRATAPDAADAETSAMVLGWAIVQEQFVNARSWMWLRYVHQLHSAAPLWGQSQVALQLGDTASMDQLLARNVDGMPIYNRFDTASTLGHIPQALDIAYKGMAHQDGDEPLHDRYRLYVPVHAPYVQMLLRQEQQGRLNRQALHFEARFIQNPELHLLAGWGRSRQSGKDAVLQSLAAQTDQLERLEAQWKTPNRHGSLAVYQRQILTSYPGVHINQTLKLGERTSVEGSLDYRADSGISQPMQLAGFEYSVSGSVNYALGKREYLRITPKISQFATQYGDELGSGRQIDLEAGYRIRTEYPDWRIRAFITQQDFSRVDGLSSAAIERLPSSIQTAVASGNIDPVGYFIPDSNRSVGACWSMGENLAGQNIQTVYTRAWRPYFDVCLRDNTLTGKGFEAMGGIAGTLTGEDHISLELRGSDGLTAVDGVRRTLNLRYRHYF